MKRTTLAFTFLLLASCEGGNLVSIDASSLVPDTLEADEIFRKISFGYHHACALMYDSSVRCWGDNSYRAAGRVTAISSVHAAARVTGLTGVSAIAAGKTHSCAGTSSTLYCWGSNTNSALGTGGAAANTETPTAVSGWSSLSSAPVVAGGANNGCAINSSTGVASCWGQNLAGQVGDGSTTTRTTPVAVSGITSGATDIAMGGFGQHTCAVVSGTVKCWGDNSNGQLGNNSTTDSSTPVTATGLTGVVKVAVGDAHSCALTAGGDVYCWGASQLNNTITNTLVPTKIASISGASAIAAGSGHSCALVSGAVKCWGYNGKGQLGNGTTTDSATPVTTSGLGVASSIAAGGNTSCAVMDAGTAYCWGDDTFGQLGDGYTTTTSSSAPVLVIIE